MQIIYVQFDLKYSFYDSDSTHINEHLKYGLIISPKMKNNKFRPFMKVYGNTFRVNKSYDITEHLLETKFYNVIRDELNSIRDIERYTILDEISRFSPW